MGLPHLHVVTDASLHKALRLGALKLHEWQRDITLEAVEFSAKVVGYGFGPLYRAEAAYGTRSAAGYLAGYIPKQEKRIEMSGGRNTRAGVLEGVGEAAR